MRQMISGLVAAAAVMFAATAPAAACGFDPCQPVAPVYSGCNTGCGGYWGGYGDGYGAHERLSQPPPQYYHLKQGPTHTPPRPPPEIFPRHPGPALPRPGRFRAVSDLSWGRGVCARQLRLRPWLWLWARLWLSRRRGRSAGRLSLPPPVLPSVSLRLRPARRLSAAHALRLRSALRLRPAPCAVLWRPPRAAPLLLIA